MTTKKLFAVLAIWLGLIGSLSAQDVRKVAFPSEVKTEAWGTGDPDIEGKVWNRWTSKDFIVCSIDDKQAQYLYNNLEGIKSWTLTRWGLPDLQFGAECKVICVKDPKLYKKLFQIENSKVEVRRDEAGRAKEYVIFLLLDSPAVDVLPMPITEVTLSEYERQNNVRFGWWFHRGIGLMNSSLPQIRSRLQALAGDIHQRIFDTKGILTMSEAEYAKLSAGQQDLFDKEAMALLLMLRKEFGQDKLLEFVQLTGPGMDGAAALQKVYQFQNYQEFDASFARYLSDLSADITGAHRDRNTPDSYLQVKAK